MKNLLKIILLLFVCQLSFAQKLVYKNRGNIKDELGNNLSSGQVKSLLSNNEALLEEYSIGRTKKTVGNVLPVGGATLAYGVTVIQLNNGTPVSTGIFAVGVISMLVAIPVKIGFTKKSNMWLQNSTIKKLLGQIILKLTTWI